MKHKRPKNITEGFRFCVTCEDEFLDSPENWKRANKKWKTGWCTTCYNDSMKKIYKKNPAYKSMKLKCNQRYAARQKEKLNV